MAVPVNFSCKRSCSAPLYREKTGRRYQHRASTKTSPSATIARALQADAGGSGYSYGSTTRLVLEKKEDIRRRDVLSAY
jgi:hypothetical protein